MTSVAERKGVLTEFKEFVLRGNVVDLAVAVVIGAAFGAVVTALVSDLFTPLISAIFGGHGAFDGLSFTVHHSVFLYGAFLDAIISFVCIAAAIFFLVVKPLNALALRRQRGVAEPEATTRPCPECLTEIPKLASRCSACTAEVGIAP
jgi:large conductance mechanosensitive channel